MLFLILASYSNRTYFHQHISTLKISTLPNEIPSRAT
jgi:hypothetical protein